MKRTYDTSRLLTFFIRAGLIAALVAVLLAPTTINAGDRNTTVRIEHGWQMLKRSSFDALPLPPIPYLETMPWLSQERTPKGFKIDTLLAPAFELMRPETAAGGASLPVSTSRTLDISGNG
jgi:hypothetical protein